MISNGKILSGLNLIQVKFFSPRVIGLLFDEYPVIAKVFDEPIEDNMVFAIEPKNFIENVGLVGVENSFVVQKGGARSITGNLFDIIEI